METINHRSSDKSESLKTIEKRLKELRLVKQKSNDLKVHRDTDNMEIDER